MISSAIHTGDNEFELDGVPLGQMRGVRCGKCCVCVHVCCVLGYSHNICNCVRYSTVCGICDCVCVYTVCISTCGKLIAVSVSCSPELLLSFSATSTPLLTTNTSSPLTHKHKIAIVFSVSFSVTHTVQDLIFTR